MLKLIDLLSAAANQKEWKPLDRKEKEKPIVLPTKTSYVNFLDKETPRKIIKEDEEESKKKLIQVKNKDVVSTPLKSSFKTTAKKKAYELELIIKNKNA